MRGLACYSFTWGFADQFLMFKAAVVRMGGEAGGEFVTGLQWRTWRAVHAMGIHAHIISTNDRTDIIPSHTPL